MTFHLHRQGKLEFMPTAICYTQAPKTWAELRGQRVRWQQGLADSIWRHRDTLIHFSRLWLVMVYLLLFGLLSPVMTILALICCSHVSITWLIGLTVLVDVITSIAGCVYQGRLQGHSMHPMAIGRAVVYSLMMGLGYRQVNWYWQLIALLKLINHDVAWGNIQRWSA